jgi:uncharacterized delta-60 repeat protein
MWSLFSRQTRLAQPARRPPSPFRPRLEALEDRYLLSAGVLDPTFGSGGIVTTALTKGNDYANGSLLQPNGDIIVYGQSLARRGGQSAMARYTPSGNLDPTFGSGGIVLTKLDGIGKAALQADGKIVAGGAGHLVRYNANGSVDQTFGSQGVVTYPSNYSQADILIEPSTGDIVLGGGTLGSPGYFALLRYTPKGVLDSTFGTGGEVITQFPGMYGETIQWGGLALQNGHIVAAGFASTGGSGPNSHFWALARYNDNGSLDTTFGPSGTGLVTTAVGSGLSSTMVMSLVAQTNGDIVAVGQAFSVAPGFPPQWALARYDTRGTSIAPSAAAA